MKRTFLQVKYFVAVCECGYVTKAAEQLYVSQPSVSRAIRELEEEYHVELFRREKQRMILTNRGEYLWKESKKLMEQWRGLEKQMAESGKHFGYITVTDKDEAVGQRRRAGVEETLQ